MLHESNILILSSGKRKFSGICLFSSCSQMVSGFSGKRNFLEMGCGCVNNSDSWAIFKEGLTPPKRTECVLAKTGKCRGYNFPKLNMSDSFQPPGKLRKRTVALSLYPTHILVEKKCFSKLSHHFLPSCNVREWIWLFIWISESSH